MPLEFPMDSATQDAAPDTPSPTAAPAGVLAVEGEMTIYRASELRAAMLQALAPAGLALDLSQVSELDSAGVQLLVAAARSAREAGGELRLVASSPAVAETLGFLGLQHFGAAAATAESAN
jgi:anti-sigma B factor antagonist